jgi:hypothetical protein
LARSPFALQWQLLRLVVRPVQARAVQLAQVLARVRAVQLAQVLVPAQVVQLAQVLVLAQVVQQAQVLAPAQPVQAQVERQARVPALAKQAPQQHSLHQRLQSQCQPELCHLH